MFLGCVIFKKGRVLYFLYKGPYFSDKGPYFLDKGFWKKESRSPLFPDRENLRGDDGVQGHFF